MKNILTRKTTLAEVTENYAVTFKKGNMDDLQENLQQLCDNAEKVRKYKAKAADYICGKYDWDKIVQNTVKLYQKSKA